MTHYRLGQSFIVATAFAAFVHTTWSFATIFNGTEPPILSGPWFGWLISAVLFAFSVDIGQIAISADLRNGERTRPKYAAFIALAATTYFFQWYYLVAHVPSVPLGEGVSLGAISAATFVRNAAIWFVPALLPMSTILYTFSYAQPKRTTNRTTQTSAKPNPIAQTTEPLSITRPEPQRIAPLQELALPPGDEVSILVKCPNCDWTKMCGSQKSATNSLTAHRRHCPGITRTLSSSNGRAKED